MFLVQSAGPVTAPVQAPSPQPEKPPADVVAGAVGHGNVLDSQNKLAPQPRAQTGNHSTGAPRFQRTETLELKKIPRELNTISKLNEYFQRFGNIVNIQVKMAQANQNLNYYVIHLVYFVLKIIIY